MFIEVLEDKIKEQSNENNDVKIAYLMWKYFLNNNDEEE